MKVSPLILSPADRPKKQRSATQIILIGFLTIILCGTLLLSLPCSSRSGQFTGIRTALFTSVSATCVTGLVLVDTCTYWNAFGQAVILCMIQIGGLGFMAMTVLLSLLIKRRITPRERLIITQSLGLNSNEGIIHLMKRILIGTFSVELLGAAALSTQIIPIFGVGEGIWRSVFHAVSAFCNGGFDLMGGYSGEFSSLAAFRDNIVVNITICLLILIGGIGFVVWDDFVNLILHRRRFSVYSKFVLLLSAFLIVGGTLVILLLEYRNPATIGELPFGKKLCCAFFQAVTTRTAGFSTIDNVLFTDGGKAASMFLMFIGGASGSTAGGVKIATFGLLVYTALTVATGHSEVILFRRKIGHEHILRALSIVIIVLTMIIAVALVITSVDGAPFVDAMYEAMSAGATVGLSCSLTPTLSPLSHCLLILLMFFGRVGILTFTYSILLRITSRTSAVTYPEANMLVG